MAKLVFEKNFKVHFLTSIANLGAPTVAELAAGTDITPYMPVDGWQPAKTQNKSSTPMLETAFVGQRMGTYSWDLTIQFTDDDTDTAAWDLFDHATPGFVVASPYGPAVAGSRVRVYPVESSDPAPLPSAENEDQKFQVEFAVTEEPNQNAVVAA